MPRRPDFSHHQPDARMAMYRDRVGRLFRVESAVGYVLVKVEPFSTVTGGHLWWRRWSSTYDVFWTWTVVDGTFSDSVLPQDAIDEELADYDRGRFLHYGEELRVRWLSPAESAIVRVREFGV